MYYLLNNCSLFFESYSLNIALKCVVRETVDSSHPRTSAEKLGSKDVSLLEDVGGCAKDPNLSLSATRPERLSRRPMFLSMKTQNTSIYLCND
jgi:hypothetical protein